MGKVEEFVEVVSVEELPYVEDTYDITVEDTHNFFANGLLVHNCIGGNLSFEVFKHLQGVEFDELKQALYDMPGLRSKMLAGVGNAYDAMVHAVGYDNAYLELQFNKLPAQHLVNRALIDYARENGIEDKLIVTCDSHYSRPDHWREREIYKKLGWLNYEQFDPTQLPQSVEDLKCELYPKNASQVWDAYLETTEGMDFYDDELVRAAVERTHDIAHEVIGDIKPDTSMKLPNYVVPAGKTEDEALLDECKKGLITRGVDDKPEYIERLKTELRVIRDKQFSKYFLTMKAIMDVAREHMLLGPGRGCFLPDSRVKMSDGMMAPISSISVGDFVIDAYGDTRQVVDTLVYDVDEELVELEFDDNTVIRCTKDHEILTSNRGWVSAIDLNENDDIVEVR